MTYITAHSDAIRIENLFINVFNRINRDYLKYKTHGLLNADNIQSLPITTITIILDWLLFEGGVSDDARSAIIDFRRTYTQIENNVILSGPNPSALILGQEFMNKMINELIDILDQI